jgi:hypothetical protein
MPDRADETDAADRCIEDDIADCLAEMRRAARHFLLLYVMFSAAMCSVAVAFVFASLL